MVHNISPAAGLRPLEPNRRLSWKRLLILLLVLTLLAAAIWWFINRKNADSLNDTYLAGDRDPGCVRVIIANDESGSMDKFNAPREQALRQLLGWVPSNLRADDELAVVSFSGETYVAMPPTAIADLPTLGSTPAPVDGTDLAGLLSAIKGLAPSPCVKSLILLSDGIFSDLPADQSSARSQLRNAGINQLFLLVPGKDIPSAPQWPGIYPYAKPVVFDGTDPDKTGLAIGDTVAHITDQHLETR